MRRTISRPTVQSGELGEPLDDEQLRGIIYQHIDEALNRADGEITKVRADLYKRYKGDLYGTERDGYSKYTTREIFEAVEWALPDILEVFVGGDRAVVFEPDSYEDKPVAEQETDVVNYRIQRANKGYGFLAVHNFCKEALLYPTSYAEIYAEKDMRETVHKQQGLLAEDLEELLQDEMIELVSQDTENVPISMPDPQTGEPVEQMIELFDVEYRKKSEDIMLKIDSVPGEELLVDHRCTTLDLDEAIFVCRRYLATHTDLVNAGYDLDDVPRASQASEDESSEVEKYTRYFYEDEDDQAHDTPSTIDPTQFRYMCHKTYIWADVEGRGTAQLWKVMIVNGVIVEKERTDYQPFVAMSSIIQPHKHIGMSAAQAVENLQTLQTELTRQTLDNVRNINTRRKLISTDALSPDGKTIDSLLDTSSEWILVEGMARDAMMAEPHTSIIQEMLPLIQTIDQKVAMRSGVSMENELDPSKLQNTTATNYMGAMDKAGRRIGMIAKAFAETGIKQMYMKVHQLSRQYLDVKETIELRGQWVDIDPSEWQDRRKMKVMVGLGYIPKAQRVQMLMGLFDIQMQAMGMNLADHNNLYCTLAKLVEANALGAPDQFFINPGQPDWQPPEPAPDPAMILAESRSQLEQTQAQVATQEQERKMQETQVNIQEKMQRLSLDERELMSELQRNLEQINEIRAQTGTEELNAELIIAQTVETLAKASELTRKGETDTRSSKRSTTKPMRYVMKKSSHGGKKANTGKPIDKSGVKSRSGKSYMPNDRKF